ncbi:MAG: undecaprenyl-phosphate galactose phosphotransferase WbaP [Alphaproteobacteria bacterium]
MDGSVQMRAADMHTGNAMFDAPPQAGQIGAQGSLLPPRLVGSAMAVMDVLAVVAATGAGIWARWQFAEFFQNDPFIDLELILVAGLAIVAVNGSLGLYPGYGLSAPERFRRRLIGVVLVFAIVAAWDYLLQHGLWSRVVTIGACALALLLTPFLNDLLRRFLQARGRWGVPVAIYGSGPAAIDEVVHLLRRRHELGFVPVVGLLDSESSGPCTVPLTRPSRVGADGLGEIDHVFVYMPQHGPEAWERAVDRVRAPRVYLIPNLNGRRSLWVQATDLQGTLALSHSDNLRDGRRIAIKRTIDFALAVPLIVLLAPLLLTVALLIRATSRGPALFVQQRVGRDGRRFGAYKFRTMVQDAESQLAAFLAANPDARHEYETYRKLRGDPRVTAVGRILRRYSLDELPQLLNVLRGEMSLVGPRCYLPGEIPDMGGQEELVLKVKPGITGFWQVSGRNRTTFAERVEMDVYYIRNWSVAFDLYILYETIWAVLTARDAY